MSQPAGRFLFKFNNNFNFQFTIPTLLLNVLFIIREGLFYNLVTQTFYSKKNQLNFSLTQNVEIPNFMIIQLQRIEFLQKNLQKNTHLHHLCVVWIMVSFIIG